MAILSADASLLRSSDEPSLDDKIRYLERRDSYPTNVENVVARETHMSWVFMAGDRVYKLKKPVRFPYLDFSTLDRRAAACRAEFLLNRRLAPDVYLSVVPLVMRPSGLAIDGEGTVVDWLVVMRRLDQDATLEATLRRGELKPAQADRIAAKLAAFYAQARKVYISPEAHLAEWKKTLACDKRILTNPRFDLPQGRIERIARLQNRFLMARSGLLLDRLRMRYLVDAHGDLRPEHIWLCDPVIVIDCLEFDARLRALDPLDEVSFLHLECERLGAKWAGERIRWRLARILDDDPTSGLFQFYRSHRAMLRARLSVAHLLDERPSMPEKWTRLADTYLRLAEVDASALERLLRRP